MSTEGHFCEDCGCGIEHDCVCGNCYARPTPVLTTTIAAIKEGKA